MKRILSALAMLLLSAGTAEAKPFYLTVHRDFSPQEEPVVELDYENKAPFVLRIFKPKDRKEFIASQIDLSRAWRRPEVKENPARLLLQGINESSFGFDWLRATLNKSLRDPLKKQYGGGDFVHGRTRFAVGPDKLISSPQKFELVSELSVLPDEKDIAAPFEVPGFTWWYRYSGVQSRPVKLPKLPVGFYVLQVIQGDTEGQVLLVVNDIAAQVQQSSDEGIVRVLDRNGIPFAGARVSLRNVLGKWVGEGMTNANGEWFFKGKDQELIAVVEWKDSVAVVDTSFLPSVAVFPDLYLYSDRPLYRPGDTVEFKGILREPVSAIGRLGKLLGLGEKVSIQLESVAGTGTQAVSVTVSDFGTFAGKLTVPENAEGLYRLKAALQNAEHIGEVRVKEYVKPVFFVRVKSHQETARPGESITADVSAERYGGGVPAQPRYKVELYRTRVDSPQWVEDAGLGEAGSAMTYFFDISKPKNYLPVLVYSAPYQDMAGNGKAAISVTIPELPPEERNFDHSYSLQVTVGDAENQFIAGSASFIDTSSDVIAQANMSRAFITPAAKGFLRVRSVSPSGRKYPKAGGELEWWWTGYKRDPVKLQSLPITTDVSGRFTIPVPTDRAGSLEARVTLKDTKGHVSKTTAVILVGPAKAGEPFFEVKEPMLLAANEAASVGSTEHVYMLLPESYVAKGVKKGRIFVTIAGSRIFEHRSLPVNGTQLLIPLKILPEYGTAAYLITSYFDKERGWQERKIGFRILPEDKILKVSIKAAEEMLSPGSNQTLELRVKDKSGKGVPSELSVSVVDQAVLDLQPEFRPSLIDFFYPMGRLNLMSFVSSEFQSYGYGELLARMFKPNMKFAATKTPEEKKPDERDTAFWISDLKTDADGYAKISFKLPANQTHWIVAAVATDKTGKFGEGRDEFQAKSRVASNMGAPAIMRFGDELDLRFEVFNNGKKDITDARLGIVPVPGVKDMGGVEGQIKLPAGKSVSFYRRVKLESILQESRFRLQGNLSAIGEDLNLGQTLRAVTNRAPILDTVNFVQGKARVPVGEKERVDELEILLSTGLSGLVYPALDWMLVYPYGCVEQTTSTTIPNIAVARVLTKNASPARAEVAARAEKNVNAGILRLSTYRNKNGSYGWYAPNETDDYMTLNVLMALAELESPAQMSDAKVVDTFLYLQEKHRDKSTNEAVMMSYIQAKLQAKGAMISGTASELITQLKLQGAKAAGKDASPLFQSYFLLAVKAAGLENHAELSDQVKRTIENLQSKFSSGNLEDFKDLSWTGHVGMAASAAAVAGDALNAFRHMDDRMRLKLTEFLMSKFHESNFGSTYETAQVLIHSEWLMDAELKERGNAASPELRWNGSPLAYQALPTLSGWRMKAVAPIFKEGENVMEFGGRPLPGKILVRKSAEFRDFKPAFRGWEISRKYYRLDELTGAKTELGGAKLDVRAGDLIYVELSYRRTQWKSNGQWSTPYFYLEDSVPAGFTTVDEDKRYEAAPFSLPLREFPYSRRELRPDVVSWFFQKKNWSTGYFTKKTGYVMRAAFPGSYSVGPALVKDFYDEAQYAQTAGGHFDIRRAD